MRDGRSSIVAAKSRTRSAGQAALSDCRPVLRFGRILSIALITAGVVVLADVALTLAYSEPVSSIYAAIRQSAAEDELVELESRYPTSADRRAIAAIRDERRRIEVLARRFARRAETGQAIGRIIAPTMDDLSAVIIQGTDSASLQKGPGHYPETRFPGEGGTIGIAGHRTTYLAPFRHVDSVRRADRIVVEMPYARFTYRVQKMEIVDPDDVAVVRSVGYERLVLSACHPLYSAAERYIVFARLLRAREVDGVAPGRPANG